MARVVFGSRNERLVRGYQERVEQINVLEPEMSRLSDEALRAKTDAFRQRFAAGETLDDLLPEAFAVAREAAARTVWLGSEPWSHILAEARWVQAAGGAPTPKTTKVAGQGDGDGRPSAEASDVGRIRDLLESAKRPDPFGVGYEREARIIRDVLAVRRYQDWLLYRPEDLAASGDERAFVLKALEQRPRLFDPRRGQVPERIVERMLEAKRPDDWVGYGEAPPDYHPDVQDRIRQAMRGKASLIDRETGEPIDRRGLYSMRPYDVQLVAAMVLH